MSKPAVPDMALPPPDMTLPSVAPDSAEGAHFYRARTVRELLAAERERIARVFDARGAGGVGFYDPHEPAEIIRALGQNCEDTSA